MRGVYALVFIILIPAWLFATSDTDSLLRVLDKTIQNSKTYSDKRDEKLAKLRELYKSANSDKRHFDIERFRTNPVIWQDIWLYNYITYDVKGSFPRNRLIADYDRCILIPTIKITNEMKAVLEK